MFASGKPNVPEGGGRRRHRRRCAILALMASALVLAESAAGAAGSPVPRCRIGLVLSGGGALGIAHVGVLKVLEELRVPVDCIAGTSMGSIVGAAYASGMNARDMERRIGGLDIADIFRDIPPRQEQSVYRKQLEAAGFWSLEIGYSGGQLKLPRGAIAGEGLRRFLRELTIEPAGGSFDNLPIPYRAVATDIETGEMVVIGKGELWKAMRASMSIPGAVTPEEIDGRLLLDGGLVRNLPVDVARAMGAERVIAVNLGTKLLKRDALQSLFGVSMQMVGILMEQNVRASLSQLRSDDILIEPDLDGFGSTDFAKGPAIIARGEAAARLAVGRLAELAADEAAWRTRRDLQLARIEPARSASRITVDGSRLTFVNPEVVASQVLTPDRAVPPGDVLEQRIGRVYGRGDFERIDYRYVDRDGQRVLEVIPTERARGPAYLRFGLRLSSDFEGEGRFNLLGSYTRSWINSLGAEWRTVAQIGRDPGVVSEFYQPLVLSGRVFVAPRVEVFERLLDLYDGDRQFAQYRTRQAGVGIDVGTLFDRFGEVRLGYYRAHASSDPTIALPDFPSLNYDISGVSLRLLYDQLDNLAFPSSGTFVNFNAFASRTALGASDDYTKADALVRQAFAPFGQRLVITVKGGGALRGELPIYDLYQLGGFLNLSGYRTQQLLGERFVFGRAVYYHRLGSLGAIAPDLFAGLSLEAGNVYNPTVLDGSDSGNGLKTSVAGFVGADTALGPIYLGYGRSREGDSAFYLLLGRP